MLTYPATAAGVVKHFPHAEDESSAHCLGGNNCRDPVVADASSWLQGSVGATATGNELGHLRGRSQTQRAHRRAPLRQPEAGPAERGAGCHDRRTAAGRGRNAGAEIEPLQLLVEPRLAPTAFIVATIRRYGDQPKAVVLLVKVNR